MTINHMKSALVGMSAIALTACGGSGDILTDGRFFLHKAAQPLTTMSLKPSPPSLSARLQPASLFVKNRPLRS